jgi:hypothetical protein
MCFSPDGRENPVLLGGTNNNADWNDSGKPACLPAGSSKKKAPVLQLMLS